MKFFRAFVLSAFALSVVGTEVTMSQVKALAAAPVFEKNCSSSQRTAVTNAFARVPSALKAGLTAMGGSGSTAAAARKTWFGAPTTGSANYTTATNTLTTMQTYFAKTKFTIECSPSRCNDGDYAMTAPASDYFALCSVFFTQPLTGTNSQVGILVHELSHNAAHTSDHSYGQTGAKSLASGNVPQAITNADNYEYFVESLM